MNQELMPFEAEAQASEELARAARTAAEQHEREAKAAQKVLLQAARDKIKAEKQARADDWRRRMAARRNYTTPDEHAQCGIHWYCRSPKDRDTGAYWRHCVRCGQPLIYTSDRHATPQACKGQKP
jgi:hypothetical protein